MRTILQAGAAGSPPLIVSADAQLFSLGEARRELLCSVIGLSVKLGLAAVAAVSLFRLAGAYQQRMERQGEISAVLELQSARLAKARDRFNDLFMTEGEQRLIREQSQWIAPNRLRIVWQSSSQSPSLQTAATTVPAPGLTASPAARRP